MENRDREIMKEELKAVEIELLNNALKEEIERRSVEFVKPKN